MLHNKLKNYAPTMKNIILSQKIERDALRERGYIPRDGLHAARSAMESGLIKVVIGPRQASELTL